MGPTPVQPPADGDRPSEERRLRRPRISGKASALVFGACFVVTGLLFLPLAQYLTLPRWIDAEIVLALWWLIWVAGFAYLLHGGQHLTDDHAMGEPRNWLAGFGLGGAGRAARDDWPWWWWLAPADFEGCAVVLGVILAVVVAFFGLWLLVEIVIPAVAFLAYFLIRGLLARVANDRHGCEGSLPRALAWGAVWATVYTAPLALLVWFAHLVRARA
jgi:hypothetical protein